MPENLYRAHQEWESRPEDERFETLEDLSRAVAMRRECSEAHELDLRSIHADSEGASLSLRVDGGRVEPSNWSFGQICRALQAPASYLRTLPSDLVARCINEGIGTITEFFRQFLITTRFSDSRIPVLRALTSPKYGRIWDAEVVSMVEEIVSASGGRFFNPPDWSGKPSGLYASDRDVFLFFIDGGSKVLDGGSARDQLHRGFYIWNSEVGSSRFGFEAFLHRGVCGNHIIWEAEVLSSLSFRHTKGAPRRFLDEARSALEAHIDAPLTGIEATIALARKTLLPEKLEATIAWIEAHGFSRETAKAAVTAATTEEGECRTVWDVVNGLTAVARKLRHLDARIALERAAGRLLAPAVLKA